MGLDKSVVTYIHYYSIRQSSSTTPPKSSVFWLFIVLSPLTLPDLSTVSRVLPFPECHQVGVIQYRAFSDWLLSLRNMCLRSFLSFHGFIAHFFLEWNNIPLSECTTIYLSIQLLKDILVVSKFWKLQINLL